MYISGGQHGGESKVRFGNGVEYNSIAGNPLFVDMTNHNYRLREGSPCIDAGMVVIRDTDYDGRPIPRGDRPDIGAHEFRKQFAVAA